MKDQPSYGVVEIQKDMLREHGVCLPYKQALIGKEVVRSIIHGSEVTSYNLLLWYVDKVVETNLGSVVTIEDNGEKLKHTFFFEPACWVSRGPAGCYSSLMERIYWASTGILLGMTGKDGDKSLFHVAFATIGKETNDN